MGHSPETCYLRSRIPPCPTLSHVSVLTHLINRAGEGEVPVLAVHVVRARARVVSEPDPVVLDDPRVPLPQLGNEVS